MFMILVDWKFFDGKMPLGPYFLLCMAEGFVLSGLAILIRG